MGPIFDEKVTEKWNLLVPWIVYGPTDVLKMAEKSKFLAIVHAQYMNSSLCLQLRVQPKKKKKKRKKENAKEENTGAESKQALSDHETINC